MYLAQNEKAVKKDLDRLGSAKNFSEYWEVGMHLLCLWPAGEHVNALLDEGGALAAIAEILERQPSTYLADGLVPLDSSTREFVQIVHDAMKDHDDRTVAAHLFEEALYQIADVIGTPEQKASRSVPDLLEQLFPHLPEPMMMPFSVFSGLVLHILSNQFSVNDEERQRFHAMILGLWFEIDVLCWLERDARFKHPARVKHRSEFYAQPSPVQDEYWELLEHPCSHSKYKKTLLKLISKDPHFLDPYGDLAEWYFEEKDAARSRMILQRAYREALLMLVDTEGRWPDAISWQWIENRHIVRAIARWAYRLWNEGYEEYALDLFRKLLKSNPGDNLGARYDILAINLGYDADYAERMFPASMEGYIDAAASEEWFLKNAREFPEDFYWWFEWSKTRDEM